MASQTGQTIITMHILPNYSEVKTTRQWNSGS